MAIEQQDREYRKITRWAVEFETKDCTTQEALDHLWEFFTETRVSKETFSRLDGPDYQRDVDKLDLKDEWSRVASAADCEPGEKDYLLDHGYMVIGRAQ